MIRRDRAELGVYDMQFELRRQNVIALLSLRIKHAVVPQPVTQNEQSKHQGRRETSLTLQLILFDIPSLIQK